MSKSIFKPLWSLDIIKTEKWLCEMSAKGYHLIEIKSVTKVFVFEKGESKSINYRICHHKAGINATSPSLISSGWHNIFSKRKWSILAN